MTAKIERGAAVHPVCAASRISAEAAVITSATAASASVPTLYGIVKEGLNLMALMR